MPAKKPKAVAVTSPDRPAPPDVHRPPAKGKPAPKPKAGTTGTDRKVNELEEAYHKPLSSQTKATTKTAPKATARPQVLLDESSVFRAEGPRGRPSSQREAAVTRMVEAKVPATVVVQKTGCSTAVLEDLAGVTFTDEERAELAQVRASMRDVTAPPKREDITKNPCATPRKPAR